MFNMEHLDLAALIVGDTATAVPRFAGGSQQNLRDQTTNLGLKASERLFHSVRASASIGPGGELRQSRRCIRGSRLFAV